ncbi:MAG: YbjN domain-containing protein [Mycobacterium sp.]
MSEPLGELLSSELTERYLRTRGIRYFRGQHDGECFFATDADGRRLHVHLGISRWHSDVFTIRVAPACFFPAADGARLAQLADTWNQRNREVTAIVHDSSDPRRIGILTRTSQRIRDRIPFEEFACFVDRAIAGAIDFFTELAPVTELTSTAHPLVRDAG